MTEFNSYRLRDPYKPPEAMGRGPVSPSAEERDGILIERDVEVALRDGAIIHVDVHRPAHGRPVPPLIAWSPYGKHGHVDYGQFPGSEVGLGDVSELAAFEAPDPAYWVPHDYAILNADPRGLWRSEGVASYCSPEEADDYHDLVEWAGQQPWSSGKVGLTGVSYLAVSQWHVAATRPRHLAAMNPWEGWTDLYREVVRHGGMRETQFWPFLVRTWGFSENLIEDLLTESKQRELFDDYWESKRPRVEDIDVPAFVVACWADQGLHLRGTIGGFTRLGSSQKWLEVHGGKKWAYYYDRTNTDRLRAFFDHFLKNRDTGVEAWPRVRVEVRERERCGEWREAGDWPLPDTRFDKLHLDASTGVLSHETPSTTASVVYDALASGPGPHRAWFDHEFATRTSVVGHMKARLWLSIEDGDDLDVFVGVVKLGVDGEVVPFPFYGQFDDGPVALGWLRGSHRELDPDASTEAQPVLAHRRRLEVERDVPTALDVELWPSGTAFDAGDRLRLIVQGTDLYRYGRRWRVQPRHEETVNHGRHRLHTGGEYDSHLIVPALPGNAT